MRIIATKLGKHDKYDRLLCIRRDSSETSTMVPRQGILAHDLIHFVVESTLRYEYGFLGIVANGADIGFAMQQTHDLKNQSLVDQAVHSEALVESLQAQIWSGKFDAEMFLSGLQGACAMRGKAIPNLSKVDLEAELYGGVLALSERWREVAQHGSLELEIFSTK
jgi:hypothetical protein